MSDEETNARLDRIEKLLDRFERLLLELTEDFYPEEEMERDEMIQNRTDYKRFYA